MLEQNYSVLLILCIIVVKLCTASDEKNQNDTAAAALNRTIEIIGDDFVLDGQPIRILSGSVHYYRIPSEYWLDRLLKVQAAGLNAISTYVEWSFHEPEERQYRFDGDYDLAKFIEIAGELGLLVLLRVGPYICAERDFGGFPYWLLSKYPNIKLRTTDKDYIAETEIWLAKLFENVGTLMYGNGGPIVLVQVENEYGSFGKDMVYKKQLRDLFKAHVGLNALLYTTDGGAEGYISGGLIPETLTTLDAGPGGDLDGAFKVLRKYMPKGPLMNSEYYSGWLTHWGEKFSTIDTKLLVDGLDYMLKTNKSLNFYMFHGGTNFEFSSGANLPFKPTITSYDYDAPLSEAGDMTPKYYAIRELIIKYYPDVKNICLPYQSPKAAYGEVMLGCGVNLLSAAGRAKLAKKYSDITGPTLPTFERLRQRAGLVLYETTLEQGNGTLQIRKPRDRIYVFVDEEYKGLIIDRENQEYNVNLMVKAGSKLSLLVENQGRINHGTSELDFKGILGNVTFNDKLLDAKWSITGYPLENLTISASDLSCGIKESGPVLYEGILSLPDEQVPLDTFLNTNNWKRGYAWVNGHCLGRYWVSRGPQLTLYVPGVWLKQGNNTVQLLELEHPSETLTVTFVDQPILNSTGTMKVYASLNNKFMLKNPSQLSSFEGDLMTELDKK